MVNSNDDLDLCNNTVDGDNVYVLAATTCDEPYLIKEIIGVFARRADAERRVDMVRSAMARANLKTQIFDYNLQLPSQKPSLPIWIVILMTIFALFVFMFLYKQFVAI